MKIKVYKPQSPLLKENIEYFYTLTHLPEDKITTYLAFPSVFTIVTAVKDAQIDVTENNVRIINHKKNDVETNLVCEFNEPALIQYAGKSSEVVTVFSPLGINAFLEKELHKYSDGVFPSFEPFEDFKFAMKEVLSITDEKAKIKLLENYWLSKFRGFEHPFLANVVAELMKVDDSPTSISEIAAKYKVSRMTLNKHFKAYIGKTPSQFRKIVRFRNAMKQHSKKISDNQLTDIAYHLNYFDQSHMIKDFKSLTGYSPKEFFANISKLNGERINWMFL